MSEEDPVADDESADRLGATRDHEAAVEEYAERLADDGDEFEHFVRVYLSLAREEWPDEEHLAAVGLPTLDRDTEAR